MAERIITKAELDKHKTTDSAWIIIDDKVYDVTQWLSKHPGGSAVLMDNAGLDATAPFENLDHSEDARKKRDEMLVGVMEEASELLTGLSSTHSRLRC